MDRLYHVTASVNRQSIQKHGLDWTRMGATSGIAGSMVPEQKGIFLTEGKDEAEWFAAELITDRVWVSLQALELAIVEYVGWFNLDRLHDSLGDLPPAEFEALYAPQTETTITF